MNLHEAVVEIKKALPELHEAMNENGSLYYNSMGAFARFTQDQIDSRELKKLKLCFSLARDFLMNGDENLKNAMHVSYLEHLNFEDSKRNHRSYAFDLMLPPLRQAYRNIMDYLK